MGENENDADPTKAVPLNAEATGVIPVTSDPETGELNALDRSSLSGGSEAYLVVRRGALEGMQFPLSGSERITIGRSSDSKIFLDDVTVSRKHAAVVFESSAWVLSDAGSLNGTYVNKNRVSQVALADGDELQIGKFRFVFVLAASAGK